MTSNDQLKAIERSLREAQSTLEETLAEVRAAGESPFDTPDKDAVLRCLQAQSETLSALASFGTFILLPPKSKAQCPNCGHRF
jgi:hypothetical protein